MVLSVYISLLPEQRRPAYQALQEALKTRRLVEEVKMLFFLKSKYSWWLNIRLGIYCYVTKWACVTCFTSIEIRGYTYYYLYLNEKLFPWPKKCNQSREKVISHGLLFATYRILKYSFYKQSEDMLVVLGTWKECVRVKTYCSFEGGVRLLLRTWSGIGG